MKHVLPLRQIKRRTRFHEKDAKSLTTKLKLNTSFKGNAALSMLVSNSYSNLDNIQSR